MCRYLFLRFYYQNFVEVKVFFAYLVKFQNIFESCMTITYTKGGNL